MRIDANLDLAGLEDALAQFLPPRGAVKPQRLSLDQERLRLEVLAPMAGLVTLTARVSDSPRGAVLSGFDLEGGSLLRGLVLSMLRVQIAGLDSRSGRFRVYGESEGDRLHVEWR